MMLSKVKDTAEEPLVKKGKATELSLKVADVLVRLRNERGDSQRTFADYIGVSFQQYQKYEKGRDRLSLEKAMLLSEKLGLPLTVFTDEAGIHGFGETEQAAFDVKPVLGSEERELLEIFAKIPKKSRKDFLETMRGMAKMTSAKS